MTSIADRPEPDAVSDGSTPPPPPRRTGLIDRAVEKLRDLIVSGRWPVGTRIPPEPELMTITGVGRNTVREAVQSLVHNGLLRREQGRGTFVLSTSELSRPLARHLGGGSRRHELELRLTLDSAASALAAQRRTDEDLQRLWDLADRRRRTWEDDDLQARARADLALHHAVVEATHNPLYVALYSSVVEVFAARMEDDVRGDHDPFDHEHLALVEAIADRDPERAAAQIRFILDPLLARFDHDQQVPPKDDIPFTAT